MTSIVLRSSASSTRYGFVCPRDAKWKRDWADPIPQSIAHRVVEEAERLGRGIILFHDIHGRAAAALPIVLEELIKRGFNFARWDGERLTVIGPSSQELPGEH